MSGNNGAILWDPDAYALNRGQFPLEELQKYYGQWVGFSRDGLRIVVHHDDVVEAVRQIDAASIAREDVIFEWLPPEPWDTLL